MTANSLTLLQSLKQQRPISPVSNLHPHLHLQQLQTSICRLTIWGVVHRVKVPLPNGICHYYIKSKHGGSQALQGKKDPERSYCSLKSVLLFSHIIWSIFSVKLEVCRFRVGQWERPAWYILQSEKRAAHWHAPSQRQLTQNTGLSRDACHQSGDISKA